MLLLHMQIRRYFNKIYDNYLLLRDDFRIGLVISPRVAALAWGEAERPIHLPKDL